MGADLLTCIEARARERGGAAFLRLLPRAGDHEVCLPYEQLLALSAHLATRIVRPAGDGPVVLAIVASQPAPTLIAFLCALYAGLRPLIVPMPRSAGDGFAERIRRICDDMQGRVVLALEHGVLPASAVLPSVPTLALPVELDAYETGRSHDRPAVDPIAFLQQTSATTGDGKLVAVSHDNLIANLRAIRAAIGGGEDERVVSWLPLYHDMGLVGTVLFSLCWGYPLYLMKPADFIRRPVRWLRAISELRATLTAAPDFGYLYASQLVAPDELDGIDLASLRAALVGAEPIRFATLDAFHARFRAAGFRAESFVPAYGLAESTLASTLARPGAPPRYLAVEVRGARQGERVPLLGAGRLGDGAPAGGNAGVRVFSVGRPIDGLELALLGPDDAPITGDGVLGEIALRGSSIAGYIDPRDRVARVDGGLLRTGDLGLVYDGELYVVERKKNTIIRNGQNFLASLIEQRIAEILGRPAHDVIVVDQDIHDPASKVTALVENCAAEVALDGTQEAALRCLDLPIDELLFARRRVIPRTTSGKKKYFLCRQHLVDRSLAIHRAIPLRGAG
jgi:acyl-CoA synthetase (AMP-forming)/AMP-acid ligase II